MPTHKTAPKPPLNLAVYIATPIVVLGGIALAVALTRGGTDSPVPTPPAHSESIEEPSTPDVTPDDPRVVHADALKDLDAAAARAAQRFLETQEGVYLQAYADRMHSMAKKTAEGGSAAATELATTEADAAQSKLEKAKRAFVLADPAVAAAQAKARVWYPAAQIAKATDAERARQAEQIRRGNEAAWQAADTARRAKLERPIGRLEVGAVGRLPPVTVVQVLGPRSLLADVDGIRVWMEAFPTKDLAEGATHDFNLAGRVFGTRNYRSALGQHTVFEIIPEF